MGYVDDAFDKMKQAAEITKGEQVLAQSRHRRIRDKLESLWEIDRTFLTGSYDRHTKIKPLNDVDIFAIIKDGGAQASYRNQQPNAIVDALAAVLDAHFKNVETDGSAVRVSVSDDEGEASFEIVAAFDNDHGDYDVPDPDRGRWVRSNPEAHASLTAAMNSDCAMKWVPFVKMLKSWNSEVSSPVPQSFLIEVMALSLVRSPFGRYQDEFATFLGNLMDNAAGPWADPAEVGPQVDELLTVHQRDEMRGAAEHALRLAEEAISLEDEGEERKAVEKWRELFGNRMPRP